jgi:hypothetical protein
MNHPATGQPLLLQVRMAFLAQGTSFHRWCTDAGVDRSYAAKAIDGQATFPAAIALRKRILAAAGIEEPKSPRRRKQA